MSDPRVAAQDRAGRLRLELAKARKLLAADIEAEKNADVNTRAGWNSLVWTSELQVRRAETLLVDFERIAAGGKAGA